MHIDRRSLEIFYQLREFDPVMYENIIRTYQLEKEAQARIEARKKQVTHTKSAEPQT